MPVQILLLLAGVAAANAAPVTSFDDIQRWAGEGPNHAALIIDWDESPDAGDPLAWGFRWDGEATGRDMLLAVIEHDDRLFAKLDATEDRLFGLGYDAHDPNSFALSDGSVFDERGVTHAAQSQADGAQSTDTLDSYGEGWYLNFWHYASRPAGFDSAWESNQRGFATRELTDGVIDGWTLATVFNFEAYPDAAEPAPASGMPGDFNADGAVDAADYTVWRDTLGDPADYQLWRANYGAATPTPLSDSSTAPEPAAASLFICLALGIGRARCRLFRNTGESS